MSRFGYPISFIALAGSSAASSTYTSNTYLTADFATMSVSVVSTAAVASLWTIEGSNDDGILDPVTNWSTITALTVPGLYSVDPGPRWMRFRKASLDSRTSIILQGWTA